MEDSVKTEQAAEIVRPFIDDLSNRMEIAFIFGSVATGYDDETEEKNLVIIGSVDTEKVEQAVASVRDRFEEGLAVHIFTREDYIKDFLAGKIFIRKSANAPKQFFVGDDGDLWDLYYDA
jgi:hypothetical protein